MTINHSETVEVSTTEQCVSKTTDNVTAYKHVCGYCGSTSPLVPYDVHYGPGAVGWDCCPDCGGV
jgi:hypothetical protein